MNRQNVSSAKHLTLVAMLIAAIPVSAQLPAAGQFTDAQAAALIQALTAQAQGAAASATTQAQLQALLQYMMRQSSASSSAASATQAQMLVQAMAQTSAAAPSAPVSVAQAQALTKMFAGPPAGATMAPGLGRTSAAPVPTMSASPQALGLAPKKAGTIRIGVVAPKAQMGGTGPGANNVADSLQTLIVLYLSGPMLEVTPIAAMLPQQIEAEIQQKECDYVLYSAISQKLNSGGLGLLKKAMPVASMIPMVGIAGGLAGWSRG